RVVALDGVEHCACALLAQETGQHHVRGDVAWRAHDRFASVVSGGAPRHSNVSLLSFPSLSLMTIEHRYHAGFEVASTAIATSFIPSPNVFSSPDHSRRSRSQIQGSA